MESQRIYEPKYIRDQYGVVDSVADAVDAHFLSIRTGEKPVPPLATAMVNRKWLPKTAAQWEALQSKADIMLFGGAAGSLKSATILMDAAREFRNPNLMAVVFRESYPNLQDLIKKAYRLYTGYPYFGDYNKTEKTWRFPTNAEELADPKDIEAVAHKRIEPVYTDGQCAQIMFRYMANDDDVYNYQSFEFSYIAFDESTHHSEFQIQYLLSRLRSTDRTLHLRMRLGTNPGGPGHDFHLKVFLGVCPHCHPDSDQARQPFKLYTDACWSDGSPLSTKGDDGVLQVKTTQFIPGNVSDHDLFGEGNENYKANLRLQRPATAKALLAGCWSIFEGQYFNCWEENRGYLIHDDGTRTVPEPDMRMIISRKEISIPYWYPHFTGTDYGSPSRRPPATSLCVCRRVTISPRAASTCSMSFAKTGCWPRTWLICCCNAGSSRSGALATGWSRRSRGQCRCGHSPRMPGLRQESRATRTCTNSVTFSTPTGCSRQQSGMPTRRRSSPNLESERRGSQSASTFR